MQRGRVPIGFRHAALHNQMIKKRSSSNMLPNTLGELELGVLETLWQEPHLDAKAICQHIPAIRQPSLSTVQSTLKRLHRKELVSRSKNGHAYTYSPRVSRSNLLGRLMGDIIHLLHDGKLETILSSFVNVAADLDDKSLAELEDLIARKKRDMGSSE